MTALVLGILAVLSVCVAPLSLGLSVLGVVLGLVAVAAGWNKRGLGMAAAGTIVSAVPLLLAMLLLICGGSKNRLNEPIHR